MDVGWGRSLQSSQHGVCAWESRITYAPRVLTGRNSPSRHRYGLHDAFKAGGTRLWNRS
jgi:hypothetical protein